MIDDIHWWVPTSSRQSLRLTLKFFSTPRSLQSSEFWTSDASLFLTRSPWCTEEFVSCPWCIVLWCWNTINRYHHECWESFCCKTVSVVSLYSLHSWKTPFDNCIRHCFFTLSFFMLLPVIPVIIAVEKFFRYLSLSWYFEQSVQLILVT